MKRGISRIVDMKGNLHDVIPPMVNRIGQCQAAQQLGVSPFTINRWLRQNGYVLRRQYVRESEGKR